ncbi:MAG TPA: hypothetical protein PKI14_01315 [Fervidobacterium sp.]|nr:hypothetical protein [Fervidobacterium sp.]
MKQVWITGIASRDLHNFCYKQYRRNEFYALCLKLDTLLSDILDDMIAREIADNVTIQVGRDLKGMEV